MLPERARLHAELLDFVASPEPGRFDALALEVVRYQTAAIPAYGRLVASRGGLPERWQDAPLVPTELFRELDLCAAPADIEPAAIFRTSGTTGPERRGRRRVPDLSLYHAGMVEPFLARVLDGDGARRPWICLLPTPGDMPESSLSHMVGALATRFAEPAAIRWHMSTEGLDTAACVAQLRAVEGDGAPAVMLTTSFALVEVLDALAASRPIALPTGSRMMLTGGFKGRTREVAEEALLARTEALLGLPPVAVVPEYGMTELTSQAYGRPLRAPPWLRLRVVEPGPPAREVPAGSQGLVACFDLLNLDNVAAILTGDLGRITAGGGLFLEGRAPDAADRGCSLTAEELGVVEP